MDIYSHDRFFDVMMCDMCNRNTYYNNGKCYCINCRKIFYVRYKKQDNRSRLAVRNNCKIQHFKMKMNELMKYSLLEEVYNDFLDYIDRHRIQKEDINICVVENYVQTITESTPHPVMKYHILNRYLYGRAKPTIEEVNAVIEVFQIFVTFIQEIESNFTMKYDFYVMKIFEYLKIPYNYSKREFKDNTKKNKDNCYWNKFLQYGLVKYRDTNQLGIPEDDQDF